MVFFTETGNGSRTDPVPTAWGLSAPFPCTDCSTINLSLSIHLTALPDLNTSAFGLGITNGTIGLPISTAWVAIIWNASDDVPLAGFSGSNIGGGGWVAAAGSTLPVTVTGFDQLMIISAASLVGQGKTLQVFGSANAGVVGSVAL
jgi:hypothetical protein